MGHSHSHTHAHRFTQSSRLPPQESPILCGDHVAQEVIKLTFCLRGGPELGPGSPGTLTGLMSWSWKTLLSSLESVQHSSGRILPAWQRSGSSEITGSVPSCPLPGPKISSLLCWLPTMVAERARVALGFSVMKTNVMAKIRLGRSDNPNVLRGSEKDFYLHCCGLSGVLSRG